MEYDRGDSFPFDFKSSGFPFGSKSKGKMSPRSNPIQHERKGNIVFSVWAKSGVVTPLLPVHFDPSQFAVVLVPLEFIFTRNTVHCNCYWETFIPIHAEK